MERGITSVGLEGLCIVGGVSCSRGLVRGHKNWLMITSCGGVFSLVKMHAAYADKKRKIQRM